MKILQTFIRHFSFLFLYNNTGKILTVVGLVDLYIGDRSKNFILWKVSWGQYKNKLLI